MSKFIQQFAHPSRAVRFVSRRRGSVLILCVVLIVVLALIGTAMLSGTRIDRFTSQQHSYNTQIDLLVEGAKQVAKSELVADLYDRTVTPPVYRPLVEQSAPGAGTATLDGQKLYDNFDGYYIHWTGDPAPTTPVDTWLADLLPRRGTTASPVYWAAITAPLASAGFEAPDRPLSAGSITIGGGSLTLRNHVVPVSKSIAYSDGTQQTFPALREMDVATGQPVGPAYLAADADGDGVGDSLLCRLLPGELNGVTWYVATRIVDNAAKINVNTAMSKQFDFDGTPPNGAVLPPSRFTRYYTSAIGLMEMLQTYPTGAVTDTGTMSVGMEMAALLADRSNKAYPHGLMRGDPPQPPPLGQEALDNTGAGRTDFAYPSLGAALYYGVGMRLLNPGYSRSAGEKWVPYDIGDMTSLLGGFTLLKPGASPSKLENALLQSLHEFAPNGAMGARNGMTRYGANQSDVWFADSFYADSELVAPPGLATPTAYKSLRSILATHNPVSNYALAHDMNMGTLGIAAANRCAFADQHLAVNANKMPEYPTTGTGSATTSLTVAKTDVNTAKFGELWRAYWNVMVDLDQMPNPTLRVGTPFEQPGGLASYPNYIWAGNHFDVAGNPVNNSSSPGGFEEHPQQMFRSSIRDFRIAGTGSPILYIPPSQQLLLRAALAAVNTEDLRDSNSDVTRRDIQLEVTDTGAGTFNALVSVYGIERQPFITEVYVDTDDWNTTPAGPTNRKGYIAIELYNPYPDPINITGWAFAVIDRRDPTDTPTNTYPNLGQPLGKQGLNYFYLHSGMPSTTIGGPITAPWTVPNNGVPTVIPPNGYLVLENYPGPSGSPGDPEAAADRPAGVVVGAAATLYVPNLHWVVRDANTANAPNYNEDASTYRERRGGELIILQPLVAAGNVDLMDPDTIPVDSFDFTGLVSAEYFEHPPVGAGIRTATRWQYVRGNNTGIGPNWKFVYPGRYAGDSNGGVGGRHQGTSEVQWAFPGPAPAATANVGAAEAGGSYVTTHTIQLGGDGIPGTHRLQPGMTASAPFGGFARNADILQVPYIGSYRVSFVNDPASVLELNSISMDSCFANDCDIQNDERDATRPPADDGTQSREQVGRFAPIHDITAANHYDDLDSTGTFTADSTMAAVNKWRYRWAIDLFDYLTVNSPGNDYLPNVPLSEPAYTPPGVPIPARQPVDNDGDGNVGDTETLMPNYNMPPNLRAPGVEDHLPYQGLININTAPWRTLSAVPWLAVGDVWSYNPAAADGARWTYGTADGEEDNVSLAKAIVRWRDGEPARPPQAPIPGLAAVAPNGPFASPFELYRVPDFLEVQQKLITSLTTAGPDDAEGDFSPYNATSTAPNVDTVRFDFEEQFLLLNRVSNLITTHSDSYTVYILVQGWQDVGSATPRLVAQRRVAFIQDRSSVRPDNTTLPPPVNVPND